jgi:hypothetical protein
MGLLKQIKNLLTSNAKNDTILESTRIKVVEYKNGIKEHRAQYRIDDWWVDMSWLNKYTYADAKACIDEWHGRQVKEVSYIKYP